MSDQFELIAEVRTDLGKGASRRLRRFDGRVPGIIYGGDKAAQPVSLIRKDLEKALENEAFYSHVLAVKVGDVTEKAILKDMQRHPAKNRVTHVDFLRIDDNEGSSQVRDVHAFVNDRPTLTEYTLPITPGGTLPQWSVLVGSPANSVTYAVRLKAWILRI